MMGRAPLIVASARTPVGRAYKGGLREERPDDLLAAAIRSVLDQAPGVEPEMIDDVIAGCARPQQSQGTNVGRRAALLAGLPESVPGHTVSRFCASSLDAIRAAAHAVAVGEGELFIAAGVESISMIAREVAPEDKHPMLSGAPEALCDVYIPMGETAERVADAFDVSREEMDLYAQLSQERAVAAQLSGFFDREITPYRTAADETIVADESPRAGSRYEKLAELEPVFRPDGRVTAGNACPLNDGAAAVIVCSEPAAERFGLEPRARIVSSAAAAVAPELMGVGPIGAIKTALSRAGMTIGDVDVVELNEAFAAQVIPVCQSVGLDPFGDRVNPHGGAIAIGHPFGMTGARIMCTLLNDLESLDASVGLETMCAAGGQGMAMIVERTA